jgi:hypothetical protein
MKKFVVLILAITIAASCKKKEENNTPSPTTNYSSMSEFYAANAVKTETFTVDATAGGSFTTAKGTKVTIPSNALTDELGNPATGVVKVEFRDIYKKSDMLLSDMPTMMGNGKPLKSGGEFFIKITRDTLGFVPDSGKAIIVQQPLNGLPVDSAMKPFVWGKGAGGGPGGWFSSDDNVAFSASGYIMSLYRFSMPATGGTWCNSDNLTYFAAYPQTVLNIVPAVNPDDYQMDIYLVFKGINSMIHVYRFGSSFPYNYAPVGLECTVVAVGLKDAKLHASFADITITANQTVNVSLAEISEADFKTKLNTLNNN